MKTVTATELLGIDGDGKEQKYKLTKSTKICKDGFQATSWQEIANDSNIILTWVGSSDRRDATRIDLTVGGLPVVNGKIVMPQCNPKPR